MTKEFIEKNWDVIVALKEGRRIEYCVEDDWFDTQDLKGGPNILYRVAPEPREFWLDVDYNIIYTKPVNDNKLIHVREVL